MNGLALILSALTFLLVFDRLRLINWRTTKAYAVLQYLFEAAVALWVLYDACSGTVAGYQWLLLAFVIAWLLLTRGDWIGGGAPEHIQTGHGDLGKPELRRSK